MTDRLFDRRCTVAVDGLLVEGLRVAFTVKKTGDATPNTAEIRITNLAAKTRAAMQTKGAKVILSAGYASTLGVIFAGDARTIDHVRAGPDWVTKIQCGDGERAYALAAFSDAFAPGTPVSEVLNKLGRALGIDVGNLPAAAGAIDARFLNGYTARGRASRELDALLRSHGYEWSIQDGRLQVLKRDKPTTEQAVVLSPTSGLVGSPEHGTSEKPGQKSLLRARSLLQPRLKPGGQVVIEAFTVRGAFKVRTVQHAGDTAGGDWYSDLEAAPL